MKTLAVETSTRRGTIAAGGNANLLFEESFAMERGQGSGFFEALERAFTAVPDFNRIIVGLGPGTYSGVRTAIAALTGIALVRKVELAGCPSVCGMDVDETRFRVVGDARRGAFYHALVENRTPVEGPELLSPDEVTERVRTTPDVAVYASEDLEILPRIGITYPAARHLLTAAAYAPLLTGTLEPIYLQDPHITTPRPR